jgi:hypothetical protein
MFDEALRSSEDFELWLRVVKAGHQIVYHRRPLVRYRRHASSQSANALWMYNHSLKALEKARLNFVLASGELKAVEKKIAEFGALKALTEGKQALHRGDLREAIEKLDRANGILRRKKVDLALMMLRLSPQTLVRLVGIRRRFLALKPELVRKQYDAIGR